MKANLHPQSLLRSLRRRSAKPVVEQILQGLAAAAAGFFLSGFRLSDSLLPLPLCLSASLGLNAASFGAFVGGCLGYLVFYPFYALEMMAAGLLVQAALCIFGEDLPKYDKWFSVGCSVAFTALVGFLFLLEQRFAAKMVWRYMLRVFTAGGGALCFRMALLEKQPLCRLVLLACLCAGACAVKIAGLPLGAVAACALAVSSLSTSMSLITAALCGLALDLAWAPGCATGVLVLGALAGRWGSQMIRSCVWLLCVLVGVVSMQTSSVFLAAAVFGLACSFFVPVQQVFPDDVPAVGSADPRLGAAAGLLHRLGQDLAPVRRDRPDPEMAAVFDQAAERVCRVCGGWDRCWNENVSRTVEELEYAAPAMMTRGRAERRDLPESFVERCCHVDGFLTAVNRELDDLSCRRQCRSRIGETRRILSYQYDALARALAQQRGERAASYRYRPEVGFCSREARERDVSGDRGATFRVGKYFYLILCDGMGTGAEAEAEANTAIELLRTLLQAGVEASEAMQILNGIYILRDDGGFATVDLVRADLTSGEAQLLKWGAAPSYLKRKNHVEKLGMPGPPPGIGLGEDHLPEEMKLSLAKGEMLVLLSDGAATETAERFLRQYAGSFPKEVACGVIGAQPQSEDDRTAAVLALRPRIPK